MKIEWLFVDVTAVRSPDIEEHAIFRGDLGWALFWPIQAVFLVGEPIGDVGIPS